MNKLKLILFGTPQIAADIFAQIANIPVVEIVAVVTAPDRPAGRGHRLQSSPVKQWAAENNIPVFTPEKVTPDLLEELLTFDLGITCAFGQLFKTDFLNTAPPLWNLHYSLLPKWRGTSPVQSSIAAGETVSGVTIFQIQKGMDDGPIIAQHEVDIADKTTSETYDVMNQTFTELLHNVLPKLAAGEPPTLQEQEHDAATFCHKLEKSDGLLNPFTMTADEAKQKILAYEMWPQTFLEIDGQKVKIIKAFEGTSLESVAMGEIMTTKKQLWVGFQEGTLEISELQLPGKKPMTAAAFLAGYRGDLKVTASV
jgi:methionyl-tRNA formyltransferase